MKAPGTAAAAILAAGLAIGAATFAAPPGDADPVAAWTRHLRGCLAGVQALSARFHEELLHPLGDRGAAETGTLELRRGGRLRLEYDTPSRRIVASDGKLLRSWDPASRLFVEQPVRDGALPAAFAFALGEERGAGCSAVFLGGAPTPDGGRAVIAIAPARGGAFVERVALVLGPACPGIERVVVTDRRGTAVRLTLSAVRLNRGIGHRRFVLEPPPGATVVRP